MMALKTSNLRFMTCLPGSLKSSGAIGEKILRSLYDRVKQISRSNLCKIFCMPEMTLKQVAEALGARLDAVSPGQSDVVIRGVSGIEEAKAGEITFIASSLAPR